MFPPDTRILIVDDYALQRELLRTELRALGFTGVVHLAENGREGLKVLEECLAQGTPVQLILSDWEMPEMNGYDFLLAVRADSRYQSVPIVLVTSIASQEQIVRALRAGVFNYITKPFTRVTLADKLLKVWKMALAQAAKKVSG